VGRFQELPIFKEIQGMIAMGKSWSSNNFNEYQAIKLE
jgi:hypothetical protein